MTSARPIDSLVSPSRLACYWVLRTLRWVAILDLSLLALTGGYPVPGTLWHSLFPCTSVFVILLSTLLLQWFSRDKREVGLVFLTDMRLFLLVWLLFLSNFRWRGSGDTVAASEEPFALLQRGDLYLDAFYSGDLTGDVSEVYPSQGHLISKYSSAPGLCLVPFDLVPGLAGVHPDDLFLHQTQKIGASCMVALSVLFLVKALGLFLPRPQALGLCLVYALGTSSLSVSSQAIWQHAPGQFFLCLGLWGWLSSLGLKGPKVPPLWKDAMVGAGISFGMAVWARYTNLLVLLPVLAWTLWRDPRRGLLFILGMIVPALALLGDNYFHSGNFWSTGYGKEAGMFGTPLLTGLAGLLFSPARGIFWYSPFVIFSFWGFGVAWREPRWSFLRPLSLGALGVMILCAQWHAWDGAWCFGPRLLADLSPLWVLALVPLAPRLRSGTPIAAAFWVTVVFSILLHVMGAYLSWWWEDVSGGPWSLDRHPIIFLLMERFSGVGRLFFVLALLALAGAAWNRGRSLVPQGSKRRRGLAG